MLAHKCVRLKPGLWRNAVSWRSFSFSEYGCVGFDLDHTLCRYNLRPLSTLIYDSLAKYAVQRHHYPDTLLQHSEADRQFAQKGLVLDIERGNLLKLSREWRVSRATHGTRPLSASEIREAYGDARFEPGRLFAGKHPFYLFKDAFVTPGALFAARLIDARPQQTPEQAYRHYLESVRHIYARAAFGEEEGGFFGALKASPGLYMQPCSQQLRGWLRELKRNATVFLLTGANHDSAEFIAQFVLGEDWKDYFDLIVTFARKPGFFTRSRPFFQITPCGSEMPCAPGPLTPGTLYSQGNLPDLLSSCSSLRPLGPRPPLYVGDSLVEDVHAASTAHLEAVAVVEEIGGGVEARGGPWGSGFLGEDGPWGRWLAEHARVAVPCLEALVPPLCATRADSRT